MEQQDSLERVHGMTLSNRLPLFVPGIMYTALLVLIFANGKLTEQFQENWIVVLFFFIMAGLSFYFGTATRLITSPRGIKYYFFPPWHYSVPWRNLKNISGNQRGVVHLSFAPEGEAMWFQKLYGNTIQLSGFVDDWETSELVFEIKKYAPQLNFPEQLIIRPKLKLWHRPGIILVYYIICFVPYIFLGAFAGNMLYLKNPIGIPLILAAYGFLGGIFGGMSSLIDYSKWLIRFRIKKKFARKFERTVILSYLLPFTGWGIVFIIGLIAQFLGWDYYANDHLVGIFHGLSLFIGFIQSLFLPHRDRREENHS